MEVDDEAVSKVAITLGSVSSMSLVDRVDHIYTVLIDGATSLEKLNSITNQIEEKAFTPEFFDLYKGKDLVNMYIQLMKLKNSYSDTMRKINTQFDFENFVKLFGSASLITKFKDLPISTIQQLAEVVEKARNGAVISISDSKEKGDDEER